MTPTTAKTLVLVAYAGMLSLIALNTSGKYTTNGGKFKAGWAASVFTLVLSILADVAPQVAGPLALLALTAVAFKNPAEIGPLFKTTGTNPGRNAAGTGIVAPATGG